MNIPSNSQIFQATGQILLMKMLKTISQSGTGLNLGLKASINIHDYSALVVTYTVRLRAI